MASSTQVATLWQHLKHREPMLILIGLLTLLVLLALVGTGISHALQGAVLHGGLIAPGPQTTPPPA